MVGRRSYIEIIGDILRLGKSTEIGVRYSCDLSYYQSQKYLRFLVTRGFLEMDRGGNSRKRYKPTTNGEQLLSYIDDVRELMRLPDRDADMTEDVVMASEAIL